MTRNFNQLEPERIQEILVLFFKEKKNPSEISLLMNVDRSTVYYHVKKCNKYALIQNSKKTEHRCHHTALKCLLCGRAHDYIKREELEIIDTLKKRIAELERRPL